MRKLGWCAAVVLMASAAVRADTFTFSYTSTLGGPVSASGTITATEVLNTGTLDAFQVTSITGTRNAETIVPPEGGGVLYWGPNVSGSLYFSLFPTGVMDSVTFNNGGYVETGAYVSAGSFSLSRADSLSITRAMPEPATLALFLTMGLGAFVLVRKLPANKRI